MPRELELEDASRSPSRAMLLRLCVLSPRNSPVTPAPTDPMLRVRVETNADADVGSERVETKAEGGSDAGADGIADGDMEVMSL